MAAAGTWPECSNCDSCFGVAGQVIAGSCRGCYCFVLEKLVAADEAAMEPAGSCYRC